MLGSQACMFAGGLYWRYGRRSSQLLVHICELISIFKSSSRHAFPYWSHCPNLYAHIHHAALAFHFSHNYTQLGQIYSRAFSFLDLSTGRPHQDNRASSIRFSRDINYHFLHSLSSQISTISSALPFGFHGISFRFRAAWWEQRVADLFFLNGSEAQLEACS